MGRIIIVGDVNQSIYGFRGADITAIPSMTEMLGARKNKVKTFPLTVCRRCPKSHIRLAQAIVPDIQHMTVENCGTEAPEGEIFQLSDDVAMERMVEGDMGIARTNKVLIPAAYALIKQKKKVIIRGRDIGKGITALIKKMRCKTVVELLKKLNDWYNKELEKLMAKEGVDSPDKLGKGANKLQAIEDKVGCIEALCDGVETIDELLSNIDKIFGDFDDNGKPKNAVILGTVHRTKGLEAFNITMLDPENFPHSMARKPWERQQERNLAYVGVTRAKFQLSKDGSVVQPGRLTFVGSVPSIYRAGWLMGMAQYPQPKDGEIDVLGNVWENGRPTRPQVAGWGSGTPEAGFNREEWAAELEMRRIEGGQF